MEGTGVGSVHVADVEGPYARRVVLGKLGEVLARWGSEVVREGRVAVGKEGGSVVVEDGASHVRPGRTPIGLPWFLQGDAVAPGRCQHNSQVGDIGVLDVNVHTEVGDTELLGHVEGDGVHVAGPVTQGRDGLLGVAVDGDLRGVRIVGKP